MDFADFIAPMPADTFLADYFGQRPVQIRGPSPRASLLSLSRLQQLLSIRPHWTEDNLKLILNSRAILPHHFLAAEERGSRRADAAKVALFVRMGATLVGDHLEDIDPVVREAAAMLSQQFAATAGANIYYSSEGVRAFDSHCDLHEVFAVQLEGEKTWRIYENRAESPVEALEGPDAQAMIDGAKGRVMMTVRMEPGDLLYIPRGYFHDALSHSGTSLHLTFGVAPLDGRIIFRVLEELAKQNPKFRAYLPDGRSNPEELGRRLAELGREVEQLAGSGLFQQLLTSRQRARAMPANAADLGNRAKLDHYAPTIQRGAVEWTRDGAVLRHEAGQSRLGAAAEAIEWALEQPTFSREQLDSQFPWLSDAEIAEALDVLTRAGLFVRYEPHL